MDAGRLGLDLLAACGLDAGGAGTSVAALFAAGLAGSIGHCAAMCGPLVLGQAADRMARTPAARLGAWTRIGAGTLLPYHLGRLATYGVLGGLAATAGGLLSRLPFLDALSGALLLAAALAFLWRAVRRWLPAPAAGTGHAVPGLPTLRRLAAPAARLGGFGLGLVLGLLPCGMLYAALAVAAATGRPAMGAALMVAFGAGTVPVLAAIGIGGQFGAARWRPAMAAAAPYLMLFNAALLAGLAWNQLAG